MWFDAAVVIRGTVSFLVRYIRARLIGRRAERTPSVLDATPEVTWFLTTRDLPGPLLHTLVTGIAKTKYPNLRIVVLDCGQVHSAQKVADKVSDPRISVLTAPRTQPEWYEWICQHVETDYFVVTHDDLHFVGQGWLEDLIQPMLMDKTIGCVCGEAFPVRLNTVEPGGERVDLTFGLSTWMWASRRNATNGQTCDFRFAKRGLGKHGTLEVWDQGGLWLEQLKCDGWRIAIESPDAARKWQHFENFDWTRDAGDRRYARLKHHQRTIVSLFAQLHLLLWKIKKRA